MSKHTPGPWKANFAISGSVYIFGGDRNFASVFDEWQDEANQEANASLIAAAPDLLAALQAIVKSLVDQDDEGMIEHAQQMIDARAAIAKATGGQP